MHSLRSDSPFRKGPKLLAVQCSAVQSARPRHMTLQRRLSIFTPHSSLTTVVTESGGRFNLQKWMQKRRKKEGRKGDHHQSILNPSGGQNELFFFLPGAVVSISLPSLISSVASPQSARLAAVLCCSFRSYLCLFPRLADIFTATRPTATAASLLDTGISPGEGGGGGGEVGTDWARGVDGGGA